MKANGRFHSQVDNLANLPLECNSRWDNTSRVNSRDLFKTAQ